MTENIPAGIHLHTYRIPVPGIRKKVIYHFSDVHLTQFDALSGEEEIRKAQKEGQFWAQLRCAFARNHGESYTNDQLQSAGDHFRDFLKASEDADAVVMTGDIQDYVSDGNLRFLRQELENYPVPVLSVLGNHEKVELMPEGHPLSQSKNPIQVLELEDLLLIGVDDSLHRITPEQNARLAQLQKLGKPMLIAIHIPVLTEVNTAQGQEEAYFQLNPPGASREVLDFVEWLKQNAGQIVAVLAGHTHFANNCVLAPGLTQYIAAQGILGNLNRYEIGV